MMEEFKRNERLPAESVARLGTMLRTARMFKRNGGTKKSLYKTDWDVPRMNGDDTMSILAKRKRVGGSK